MTANIKVKETKKDLAEKVRSLLPHLTDVNAFKVDQLKDMLAKDCTNTKVSLANINNSCYLDSIIVAMLQGDAKHMFLDADIHKYQGMNTQIAEDIKKELIYLSCTKDNNQKLYCTDLRKLLQRYQDEYHKHVSKIERIDWIRSQSEPLDFMRFLNIIFNIPDHLKIQRESWGSKKKVPVSKMTKISIKNTRTNFTTLLDLQGHQEIDISDYYPKHIEHTEFDKDNEWRPSPVKEAFTRRSERITYLSTPFLHIHLNRLTYDGKLDTTVIPRLKMKLKENRKNIYLRSMIIHHGKGNGGHYTCIYECLGKWYHYDDLRKNIQFVGSFEDLLNQKKYLKNSTDLFYW